MDENPIINDPPEAEARLRGGAAKAGSFQWTPEAVRTLQTLWMEGRSGSEIAERLGPGLTRSAVLGKLHRLEHPSPRIRVLSRHKKLARKKPEASPQALPMVAPVTPLKVALGRRPDALKDIAEKPLGERASITELHPAGCRWPIGFENNKHLFCNHHRLSERPYCPVHHAASYTGGK